SLREAFLLARTTLNMPSLAASLRSACPTSSASGATSSGRAAVTGSTVGTWDWRSSLGRARLRITKLATQPARKAAATKPNTIICSLVNPKPFPLPGPPAADPRRVSRDSQLQAQPAGIRSRKYGVCDVDSHPRRLLRRTPPQG